MTTPAGWYHGEGDPPGTQRYWNGSEWVGEPVLQVPPGPPPGGQAGTMPPPAPYGVAAAPGFSLARLFSASGRINRTTYVLMWVVAIGVVVALATIDAAVGTADEEADYGVFTGLGSLAMIWPGIATAVKRLHDFNASGWWVLGAFVPFGSLVLLLFLLFRTGTPGPNNHGYPPGAGFTL